MEEDTESLLDVLKRLHPESTTNTLREWIKQRRVLIDGLAAHTAKDQISSKQTISLDKKGHKPERQLLPKGLRMLYQDQHIVVIDKPSGILTVAAEIDTGKHVHGILKQHLKPSRVYPVHRLDRNTSGVLIFALTETARDTLKEAFCKRTIKRIYTAVAEGQFSERSGTWESFLYDDPSFTVRTTTDPTLGKRAVTHYKGLKKGKQATLLELKLETGRKNQIRVHCQEAGHPIVGDSKYGATTDPIKRLCLHAHFLAFDHPITGKPMEFISPAPLAFEKALHKVRHTDA